MRASELLRRLRRRATRLGIPHVEVQAKGSHVKVTHGSAQSVVPVHSGDLARGTLRAILRQLGINEGDLDH